MGFEGWLMAPSMANGDAAGQRWFLGTVRGGKRRRDETGEGRRRTKRRRRRVRFSPRPQVLGVADAGVDRGSTVPELFDCDSCGNRIHAGLRGFELYATCTECSNFDVCLECCQNADAARRRLEAPACARHPHALVLVDRNMDTHHDEPLAARGCAEEDSCVVEE